MYKKLLTVILAVLLLNLLSVTPAVAGTRLEELKFAEKVKEEIVKLGTGPDAQIEVKLRDKRTLKGYVLESEATQFVVVEAKTGVVTSVLYPQVQKVKGNNLATGVKIAVGVGIALVALVLFCFLYKPCASS